MFAGAELESVKKLSRGSGDNETAGQLPRVESLQIEADNLREELKVSPYVDTAEFMKKAKQSNTLIDTFLVLAPCE